MDKETAEKLLKDLEYELWWLSKYSGDHPSQDEVHRKKLNVIRTQIMDALLAPKLPNEPLGEPIYPNGLHYDSPTTIFSKPIMYSGSR